MKKCFVVQPFDKGKFDARYIETFKPAIIEAGLEPYRVDNDPSVEIPINEIHKKIDEASIVFVEITTDNPNVWYELGYAFAKNKTVVMVSSDERESNYPFDVRHRTIIPYGTQSASQFEKCKNDIVNKIRALIEKNNNIESFEPTIAINNDILSDIESTALAVIMANQVTDEDLYSVYSYQEEMKKKGYNGLGSNMTLRKLEQKEYLTIQVESDWNHNEYLCVRLTEKGISWMIEHEHEFDIRVEIDEGKFNSIGMTNLDDDIPF